MDNHKGVDVDELESESEIIDAVFSSPPYYNKLHRIQMILEIYVT